MTIDECITTWAVGYKEPFSVLVHGEKKYNPILLNTRRWLNSRFDDSFNDDQIRIKKFCEHVIDNFKPTNNNPFPTNGHLTDFYNDLKGKRPLSQIDHKPITLQDTAKAFAESNGISYLPPEKYKDIDIDIVTDRLKNMSIKDGMIEFGILLYGESVSQGVLSRTKIKRNLNRDW